ncbi:hypothetical protein AGLY_014923 [Aphis glycines]|uniref:Uncharacterized protein n=1 Tax=Aphis glycines TaxID=307491 RepID=A0A6G0T2K9_APHGL|nr:hypothetical protein AGLY_014923 [Aphis glycines]
MLNKLKKLIAFKNSCVGTRYCKFYFTGLALLMCKINIISIKRQFKITINWARLYLLYIGKASPDFLSHIQIHIVQRIVTKYFTVIPDSLLEVLIPLLLRNMSNILKFLDFYRNMLFCKVKQSLTTYLRMCIICRIDDESIIIVDVYEIKCTISLLSEIVVSSKLMLYSLMVLCLTKINYID